MDMVSFMESRTWTWRKKKALMDLEDQNVNENSKALIVVEYI